MNKYRYRLAEGKVLGVCKRFYVPKVSVSPTLYDIDNVSWPLTPQMCEELLADTQYIIVDQRQVITICL